MFGGQKQRFRVGMLPTATIFTLGWNGKNPSEMAVHHVRSQESFVFNVSQKLTVCAVQQWIHRQAMNARGATAMILPYKIWSPVITAASLLETPFLVDIFTMVQQKSELPSKVKLLVEIMEGNRPLENLKDQIVEPTPGIGYNIGESSAENSTETVNCNNIPSSAQQEKQPLQKSNFSQDFILDTTAREKAEIIARLVRALKFTDREFYSHIWWPLHVCLFRYRRLSEGSTEGTLVHGSSPQKADIVEKKSNFSGAVAQVYECLRLKYTVPCNIVLIPIAAVDTAEGAFPQNDTKHDSADCGGFITKEDEKSKFHPLKLPIFCEDVDVREIGGIVQKLNEHTIFRVLHVLPVERFLAASQYLKAGHKHRQWSPSTGMKFSLCSSDAKLEHQRNVEEAKAEPLKHTKQCDFEGVSSTNNVITTDCANVLPGKRARKAQLDPNPLMHAQIVWKKLSCAVSPNRILHAQYECVQRQAAAAVYSEPALEETLANQETISEQCSEVPEKELTKAMGNPRKLLRSSSMFPSTRKLRPYRDQYASAFMEYIRLSWMQSDRGRLQDKELLAYSNLLVVYLQKKHDCTDKEGKQKINPEFTLVVLSNENTVLQIKISEIAIASKDSEQLQSLLTPCTVIAGTNLRSLLHFLWTPLRLDYFFLHGGRVWDVNFASYVLGGHELSTGETYSTAKECISDALVRHLEQLKKMVYAQIHFAHASHQLRVLSSRMDCVLAYRLHKSQSCAPSGECDIETMTTKILKKAFERSKKKSKDDCEFLSRMERKLRKAKEISPSALLFDLDFVSKIFSGGEYRARG